MLELIPSLKRLRPLAGEGDFHVYRQLERGRRLFLFAKFLDRTLAHGFRPGHNTVQKTVVLVRGKNQIRLWNFMAPQLIAEFGEVDLFSTSNISKSKTKRLAGFSVSAIAQQVIFLILMLVTGRKRFLNLYFLAFQAEIDRIVLKSFASVQNFVCFNDQPADVAAILNALHRRADCRTIVIQHGLILREEFYFPTLAREFRAWGELSRRHFHTRSKEGKIFIKGRYANDRAIKSLDFLSLPIHRPISILAAPSFHRDEIQELISALKVQLAERHVSQTNAAIKFHPATKGKLWLELLHRRHASWLSIENEPMEVLAEKYDVLVTKNSTSAIDFLLRGKPVFFLGNATGEVFPNLDYALSLNQIQQALERPELFTLKNNRRLEFLKEAINV